MSEGATAAAREVHVGGRTQSTTAVAAFPAPLDASSLQGGARRLAALAKKQGKVEELHRNVMCLQEQLEARERLLMYRERQTANRDQELKSRIQAANKILRKETQLQEWRRSLDKHQDALNTLWQQVQTRERNMRKWEADLEGREAVCGGIMKQELSMEQESRAFIDRRERFNQEHVQKSSSLQSLRAVIAAERCALDERGEVLDEREARVQQREAACAEREAADHARLAKCRAHEARMQDRAEKFKNFQRQSEVQLAAFAEKESSLERRERAVGSEASRVAHVEEGFKARSVFLRGCILSKMFFPALHSTKEGT